MLFQICFTSSKT